MPLSLLVVGFLRFLLCEAVSGERGAGCGVR